MHSSLGRIFSFFTNHARSSPEEPSNLLKSRKEALRRSERERERERGRRRATARITCVRSLIPVSQIGRFVPWGTWPRFWLYLRKRRREREKERGGGSLEGLSRRAFEKRSGTKKKETASPTRNSETRKRGLAKEAKEARDSPRRDAGLLAPSRIAREPDKTRVKTKERERERKREKRRRRRVRGIGANTHFVGKFFSFSPFQFFNFSFSFPLFRAMEKVK